MLFGIYSYSSLLLYPGSATICNTDGKENTEELGELKKEEEEEDAKKHASGCPAHWQWSHLPSKVPQDGLL